MGDIGDHVLIRADTSRQYLRDRRIGDSGKTIVDTTEGVGIPLISDRAQRHGKCKDPIFVVQENIPKVPGF